MALPSIRRIHPFNSIEEYKFIFDVEGTSQQIFYNELEITLSSDTSQILYKEKTQEFRYQHILPANTLTNGEQYAAKVRIYDSKNRLLGESNPAFFYCFGPIILSIPTIVDNSVGHQTVLFRGSFEQNEGELLEAYQYRLYDENKYLMEKSPELYDGLLEYEFSGFADRTKYFIELAVVTTNKHSATTGLIEFTARYDAPRFSSSLDLTNLPEEASVQVECNIIRLVGVPDNEPVDFTDGEADLRQNGIWFDKGFNLEGDFTIQMWLRDINQDTTFFKIIALDGSRLQLTYTDGKIYLDKILGDTYMLQRLIEPIIIESSEIYYLCIKQINGLYDFEIKKAVNNK